MRSRNCLRCDIKVSIDSWIDDLNTDRPYTYCPKCRDNIADQRGRIKGLTRVRAMKKYGTGQITEPSDSETPEVLAKTSKADWTPTDNQKLEEELVHDDNAGS